MKKNMVYENLSKQAQPKKILEALKKVNDIKEGKKEEKGKKVNLRLLAQRLAKKQIETEEDEKEKEQEDK